MGPESHSGQVPYEEGLTALARYFLIRVAAFATVSFKSLQEYVTIFLRIVHLSFHSLTEILFNAEHKLYFSIYELWLSKIGMNFTSEAYV